VEEVGMQLAIVFAQPLNLFGMQLLGSVKQVGGR